MGFGKFGYMAPEQLIRGGIVDHRTDIYAAGVVLYEVLTGQRLYEAGPEPDYRALAKKVAKGEHDLPSKTDKALTPYDDLVATALRPKAEDRYQTAAEFRDAIQQALVGVNPTISTDQLGAFMRELFAEEMTAQRELHDRVAKAHLDDFKDQLTSQHTSTVSFAMSLPLPPEVPPPRPNASKTPTPVPRPSQRNRPPTAQTDILPQQPPQPPAVPTAAIPTTELGLADGTGTVDHPDLEIRRSKKPFAILAAAALFVGGGLVFAFTRGDDGEKAPKVATTQAPHAASTIRVDPIPPEEQSPPTKIVTAPAKVDTPATSDTPAKAIQVEDVTPPTPPTQVATAPHDPTPSGRHGKKHDPVHVTKTATPTPPVKTELTREAVIAKFRAVSRQYDVYKQQNGGRLDQDWNDLASFIQYHPDDLAEFSRRIDAFRVRMK